ENFGTWRDRDDRLVWGVNDVDEAWPVPYTLDLVRLATSALLAIREGHLAISPESACDGILDGYTTSLEKGGFPSVLDGHEFLRGIVLNRERDPKHFWNRLRSFPKARGKFPSAKMLKHMPDPDAACTFVARVAGVGSLGRRRFVAIAAAGDSFVAREAKALLPSAAAWAAGEKRPKIYIEKLLDGAVRVVDPSFDLSRRWIFRRIAPDCARIELADLPKERDEEKLLRAMGWEAANMHLGSRRKKILKHAGAQKPRWLLHAAEEMAAATTEDFRAWVARSG
ncbi:MAG TPA: DUF2252 family protein, partial [Vicinamibacterales bacterium]|nr:DUF2252 family protein [Vicinamibacterales bacterium]